MDDNTLRHCLAQLRRGDFSTFETIYESLKVPVYVIALRILGDRSLAEDVVQESFLRLYRNPPGPDVARPRAWLFRTTRNLAIDALRARQDTAQLPPEAADAGARSIPAAVNTRLDVEAALAALDPADRELVTLHLSGGLKFRELAALTGRPLGTVLWRYQRSLSLLRAQLNGGYV